VVDPTPIDSGLEVVVDAHAGVGEGPVWDAARSILIWLDIPGQLIHEYDPVTGADATFAVPMPVGSVALRERGGLVLAMQDGFWLCETGLKDLRRFTPVESDRSGNAMNDGKADPAGRFWAGTLANDGRPNQGALYRLEPDGRVERMLTAVSVSNGIDWSLDEKLMYYVDSGAHSIDVFDFDPESGQISGRRALVEVPTSEGVPDGLCVDADGYVWVAIWGSGEVRRYSPTGEVDRILRLPTTRVTSVAFGGHDLRDLYITSMADGLTAEQLRQQPQAGAVFRTRPGVQGRLPFKFGG
jgi:sugar lactone lactonase YvrE